MYQHRVLIAFEESKPIYYLGWIIQPTLNGFYVIDRSDRDIIGVNKNAGRFNTVKEASEYIDIQVKAV